MARVVLTITFLQIGLGALVAGLRAGLTYNTWPLMDGRFIPQGEHLARLTPFWRNLAENVTMVQFQHRMVAYLLLLLALFQFVLAWRRGGATRRSAGLLAGGVTVQALLGIVTLLLAVPLWAGLLHQACAMLVLALAVNHLQSLATAGRADRRV
jgi:cytochrome c oxidase assembly protein subunit 15